MNYEYVKENYRVPAETGRRVTAYGKPGVIAKPMGAHIGINLDEDRPGVIGKYHPTDGIIYLGMGDVRRSPKGRERYRRYLEYGDSFSSFLDFCRWDADKGRSWNA